LDGLETGGAGGGILSYIVFPVCALEFRSLSPESAFISLRESLVGADAIAVLRGNEDASKPFTAFALALCDD
jgi:hypothetical protein